VLSRFWFTKRGVLWSTERSAFKGLNNVDDLLSSEVIAASNALRVLPHDECPFIVRDSNLFLDRQRVSMVQDPLSISNDMDWKSGHLGHDEAVMFGLIVAR